MFVEYIYLSSKLVMQKADLVLSLLRTIFLYQVSKGNKLVQLQIYKLYKNILKTNYGFYELSGILSFNYSSN